MKTRFNTSLLFLAIILVGGLSLNAQSSSNAMWRDVSEPQASARLSTAQRSAAKREIVPTAFRTLALDRTMMDGLLKAVPPEASTSVNNGLEIQLPLPEGGFGRFHALESPIMEPGLAAKYPDIKTYVIQGIDDPTATGRLDMTPRGLRATILSAKGRYFIDPYWNNDDSIVMSYYTRNFSNADKLKQLTCGVAGSTVDLTSLQARAAIASRPTGASLRTYRLALACTGEYATAVSSGTPTTEKVLAAMVTSINRVTAVYERELAIRLTLVNNTNLLIFLNASTDPYTNSSGSTMLGQNQTRVDLVIGNANYDIGHVFSTGGGGVAGLGVVNVTGQKARGVTGLPSPVGDAFDIDFVAHEMGHQFGGNHTFNGTSGNAVGNRNGPTAYEPGSASTIMGYAGICAPQDLQNNSDDYFHSANYTEIDNYTSTGSGRFPFTTTATSNTPPVIAALPTTVTNIPAQTPFALTASATDANGDTLTYCWEEFDIGAAQSPIVSPRDDGSACIFRSYNPTTNPTRLFPSLTYILNNANLPPATYTFGGAPFATGEFLPTTDRTMTFRVSVRDNRAGGGGQNWSSMQVKSNSNTGPFKINSPNTATTLTAGTLFAVTWDVASTNLSPISCANVKISYSADGGNTFPVILAASVPNTGTANVTIPNVGSNATTTGRLKVEAVGNIFFDINGANLTVNAAAAAPTVTTFTPTSGVQNTSVVITGNDFFGATTVAFNGTASVFTVNSNTQITAKVPAGATTGPIVVTTPNGTGASTVNFTFVPGPAAPDITSFAPTNGPAGQSVTITGTDFTGATAVTFNGANSTFAVNSSTQISATVPLGATTGPIAVTTPSGTSPSANIFTFLAGNGTPAITGFSPTSASPGASVVIAGSNFAGISSVSFNGQNASFTTNSSTQITAIVPNSATTGAVTVTNTYGTGTSTFTVNPASFAIPVVISQIYGGGGNSSAPYQNDYVEIYNRDTRVINLANWSLQYASSSGTSWTVVPLSGNIQPAKYYLIKLASGGSVGSVLPTADATSSGLNISAANGKIALLNTATAIPFGTSNPAGTIGLQDFVGYGSANASETSPAPTGGNTSSILRAGNGATDTDNNSADFSTGPPNPRNSAFGSIAAPVISSSLTATGTAGAAFTYTIAASNSPTSYNATSLPANLTINTGTGVISGTPSAAGISNVSISATNAGGTGSATLVLTVNAASSGAPVISSATTVSATINSVITGYQITASNTPTSFAASNLPSGLTINSSGLISGTPLVSGTILTTISATNISGTGSAILTFNISPAAGVSTTLLAGWDFQTTTTGGTAGAASPNSPSIYISNFGTGTLYLNGTNGSSTWITASTGNEVSSFGGTATNAGTGFSTVTLSPACLALIGGTGNSANGKRMVLKFAMTGATNLVASYATQKTSLGFSSQTWETSSDGTNWSAAQTISSLPSSFGTQTLNAITALNGAANAYLRVTFADATDSVGNNRLDNIQLNASTSASSSTVTLSGPATGLTSTYNSPGTPSGALSVAGTNLTADVITTAPTGFEISKTVGGTYASSQTYSPTSGTLTSSPLFIRIAAGPAVGNVSGVLSASSGTSISQILTSGTVAKATLTPVFSGATSVTYDGTSKSLTAATTPSTTVDLSYSGTGSTVYDPSTAAPTDAGTYSVTATVNSPSYSGTGNTTLTIGKATQTITFGPLTVKTVGDPAFDLVATGGGSGQAIVFGNSNFTVASLFGSTVVINAAGQTTLTANQAGNDNFNAAAPVAQILTVNASGPSFANTFPGYGATDLVGGVQALIAYALGGSVSGDNTAILPVPTYNAGILQITFLARTNDPTITISVEGNAALTSPWSTPITQVSGVDQTGVPTGFVRQIWTLTSAGQGFLRVRVTQNP